MIARVGAGVFVVIAALLLWGTLVQPNRIGTEREVAGFPALPDGWEGREVALVADFQVGMWGANTGTARRIVRRLIDRPPATVLIAGDFLYEADDDLADHIAEAVGLVRPLAEAGTPTFAVLGNHDAAHGAHGGPTRVRADVYRGLRLTVGRRG